MGIIGCKKLKHAFDAGKSPEDLFSILQNLPDGLAQFFLNIFNDSTFTDEQREDLHRIALFVLGALRPLSADELHAALSLACTNSKWSFDSVTLSLEGLYRFKKRLTHASGGLIELVERDSNNSNEHLSNRSRVQVIHESVLEFFLDKGLAVLQVNSREAFNAECHSKMVYAAFKGLLGIQTTFTQFQYPSPGAESFDDGVLDALIPAKSWRPQPVSFVLDYVREHCFSHLDFATQGAARGLLSASDLPSSSISREALFAYLRLTCLEVIQVGNSRVSINKQLKLLSDTTPCLVLQHEKWHTWWIFQIN